MSATGYLPRRWPAKYFADCEQRVKRLAVGQGFGTRFMRATKHTAMSLYDRVRDDSAEQNNPVNCFARGGGFPTKEPIY